MTVRWGIAGPGGIAERFMAGIGATTGGEVVAVASRAHERAEAFARRYGIRRAHGAYGDLLADDDVDAVYIAVPHSGHADLAVAALGAGKHVLCEKPMAMNAREVERVVAAAAAARGPFVMEAIWSRFLPAYRTLAGLLEEGRIGRPLLVESDFGFRVRVDAAHRLFDPALGGGAALDLGIYPLQLATFVLGPVHAVSATGTLGETGVDEVVVFTTQHAGGGIGVSKAAIRLGLACTARISGERGWIDLPAFMHDPRSVTVTTRDGTETIDCGYDGDGLRFEIVEAHRCIAEGLAESPTVPLEESLALARTLDAVRADVGVVYPADHA
jgi:predicted dehydrogenase